MCRYRLQIATPPKKPHGWLLCRVYRLILVLEISTFFSNYLIDRRTQYMWNNFISPFFRADVGVGQGFALSSILCTQSICPENISLWYTPCQHLIQIKPAFHSSHLTHNMPHGGDAIVQIFCLPWQRYSHLTQPSMVESYSCQCLNTETSTQGNRGYTTEIPSISYSRYWYIRLVVTF